jgi:hypothetical protein
MAGEMLPGPRGTDPPVAGGAAQNQSLPFGAGFEVPGPIGGDAIPLDTSTRTVTAVTKDWEPPAPRTTPARVVQGKTLAAVFNELNANLPWGRGGGMLRNDAIAPGTGNVTVKLQANLRLILPTWAFYPQASTAAQAEWDQMIGKLRIHETRHMQIAIEEADALAARLIGVEVGEVAGLVTAANQTMQSRQDQLDTDTESGSKPNVPYGDVSLDTSIT